MKLVTLLSPVLAAVAEQELDELTLLSLTLSATDADLPANALTYSLASEKATTYLSLVCKGLRPVAWRRGKAPSGARGSSDSLSHVDKIVWEAGPAARPPDWRLVAEERRAGAQRAFDAYLMTTGRSNASVVHSERPVQP